MCFMERWWLKGEGLKLEAIEKRPIKCVSEIMSYNFGRAFYSMCAYDGMAIFFFVSLL